MKVLRVLRRRKIRLSFIFLLLLVFIFNTYAWISYDTKTSTGSLTATVSSWAVEFVITEEDLSVEEYTYEIPEFHPGIDPIEKEIKIYNVGDADSHLEYRIKEIYLYGNQILKVGETEENQEPETVGEEVTATDGNTTTVNMFGNDQATIFNSQKSKYGFTLEYPTPFTISYTYDKIYISGSKGELGSVGTVNINLEWENDENNNTEDTKLGNMAYDYKVANPDEPALKIIMELKALRANVK